MDKKEMLESKKTPEVKEESERCECPYCGKPCFVVKPCGQLKKEDQKAEEG